MRRGTRIAALVAGFGLTACHFTLDPDGYVTGRGDGGGPRGDGGGGGADGGAGADAGAGGADGDVAGACDQAGGPYLFESDFEGGAVTPPWGGTLNDPGDTVGVSSTTVHCGAMAGEFQTDASGSGTASAWVKVPPANELHGRAYLFLPTSFGTEDWVSFGGLVGGNNRLLASFGVYADLKMYAWNNHEGVDDVAAAPISRGAWHQIDLKVVISSSGGEVSVWIDGELAASLTGVDTGTTEIDDVRLGIRDQSPGDTANTVYFDDVVIDDQPIE